MKDKETETIAIIIGLIALVIRGLCFLFCGI